jgi:hypothetical protein
MLEKSSFGKAQAIIAYCAVYSVTAGLALLRVFQPA